MKKQLLKPKIAMHHAGRMVRTNSPTLLSALAVVGVAGTAYLTFKATWEAAKVIDNKESMERIKGEDRYTRTAQEKALLVWKLYLPAAGVGALTIGSIIASNRIQVRRLAAMAAAYGVLTGDFDEYRNKALEMLGEKKAKAIDDKVAEKKMVDNPPPVGIPLEDGQSWFCDLSTKRYFKSDRAKVEKARNDMNYQLIHEGYAELNEMYAYLGLDSTNVGGQLGWEAESRVEVIFTPIFMPDGQTATGVSFTPEPKPDFDSLH